MSQIASFTYLNVSDVPLLGFWSKPKPRLFRKPENKFPEFLKQHALRESIFECDGIYVALVFAWIEVQDLNFAKDADPVINSVRKHVEGSHWLVTSANSSFLTVLDKPLKQSDWPIFLRNIGCDAEHFDWTCFEEAKRYVRERISDLKFSEALLVSVG